MKTFIQFINEDTNEEENILRFLFSSSEDNVELAFSISEGLGYDIFDLVVSRYPINANSTILQYPVNNFTQSEKNIIDFIYILGELPMLSTNNIFPYFNEHSILPIFKKIETLPQVKETLSKYQSVLLDGANIDLKDSQNFYNIQPFSFSIGSLLSLNECIYDIKPFRLSGIVQIDFSNMLSELNKVFILNGVGEILYESVEIEIGPLHNYITVYTFNKKIEVNFLLAYPFYREHEWNSIEFSVSIVDSSVGVSVPSNEIISLSDSNDILKSKLNIIKNELS
jgi:hypothetical protein